MTWIMKEVMILMLKMINVVTYIGKTLSEGLHKFEARQAKAEEIRQKLFEDKHQKLRDLINRVDAVRKLRRNLMEKKRLILNAKLAKAEQKRKLQIQAIVKKARAEEEKEERLRKLEEKAAREAAVEERRRITEEQRRQQLLEIAERTRKRQQKIERQKFEQERKRLQQSLEKSREREERKAEMKAAQQATSEQLLHRIQNRQVKTCRRYEMNLELIKHRAMELSLPHNTVTNAELLFTEAEPDSTLNCLTANRSPSSLHGSSDCASEQGPLVGKAIPLLVSASKPGLNVRIQKLTTDGKCGSTRSSLKADGTCSFDAANVLNSGSSKLLSRKRAKLKRLFLETLEKLHGPFSTFLAKFEMYHTWLPADLRAFQKIMFDFRKFFASEQLVENEKQSMFCSAGFQQLIIEFLKMFEKASVDSALVLSRK
ncbi:unnamed protein product [Soboliphyme baturini]|uniref:Inner centromere protein A n=1 Tax=Soboliphyme baturini TaxID=241478 RepID=A0A183ILF6_9BILA|nr:unnamed protein product [Soboliphyme baturini]